MLAKCSILITTLVSAALCATSVPAGAPSGLEGVVTRSPIMPVCLEGVPCAAPSKNTPLVFFRPGRSVRTRTDAAGRYRVVLTPGWWSVQTATNPQIGSGIRPHRVRVFANRVRVVNFDVDTGIR